MSTLITKNERNVAWYYIIIRKHGLYENHNKFETNTYLPQTKGMPGLTMQK